MSVLRKVALLCFLAGVFILVRQVIFRVTGEPIASYKLERTTDQNRFEAESLAWPQGIQSAELFLVVKRNTIFEKRRSFLKPTVRIYDYEGNQVFQNEVSELHNRGRMSGRTIFFTAGVTQLKEAVAYRISATLSEELVAPGDVEIYLELRKVRVPTHAFSIAGFVLFLVGIGGLLLTRPK